MTSYLIVGDGRMARHFSHYLRLLDIQFLNWSRKTHSTEDLITMAAQTERVVLLISDGEIENFVQAHPFLLSKKLVHFSGALSFSFADSAHPLNSFGPDLYARETYVKTPFVVDAAGSTFGEILPGLPNPHYSIPREKKALYHALCVAGGNFTTLLWQSVFSAFEKDLKLPASALLPFLETVAANLARSPASALTGPIARGDTGTILRNLDALRQRPEQSLYYAFLNYALAHKTRQGSSADERLRF